jgi:cell division protein FtsQ
MRTAVPLPTPLDVRLMNFTATVLFAGLAVLALGAGIWWALRHPVFAISGISVQGELGHNNEVTLRANVAPRLAGNFFTVDLAQARAAFEAAPWVRRAVVRREFPGRLRVVLEEHHAVALWGNEGEQKLVNGFGEVFEANLGDVETDELPRLVGPQGQAAQMLAMVQALAPVFAPLDATVVQLTLSGRGGWRAELDSGAVVEMGGGTVPEVSARAQRFVDTLPQVAAKYGRRVDALETADLRHAGGYALRLRGVSTVALEPAKK